MKGGGKKIDDGREALSQRRNEAWRESFGRSESRRWSRLQKFCQNDINRF
jgi:hypothetical protein